MNSERTLDISWGTIWKIFIAAVLLYILYQTRNILVWFIFALIISILFNPSINFLRRFRVPRVVAVCSVYIAFFGILILLVYLITPLFISEIKQFSQVLPQYFEKISPPLKELGLKAFENLDSFINAVGGALEKIATNIFNVLFTIFGGIFATIFTLSLSVYLSLSEKGVERALVLFFPKKYETYILSLWERCQKKVNAWFLTRLLACFFVGLVSFLILLLFNAPYPLVLGILAGALNFIPVVGPLLTGILLFVVIFLESVPKAIFVVIVFILIQQVENNILTPLISKKIIGLSPVLVLTALAVGGILWGFLGAILSIPLAAILFEFLREFLEKRKSERTAAQ
jgi:predicted PurR-regulated permease PerM